MVDGDAPDVTSTISFALIPAAKADMNSLLPISRILFESHSLLRSPHSLRVSR
uniref:Uncharacterized protein n=1 Tax=Rhizophora mucronata TaxID=61149 RepID=A0A2P2N921_RHIMU